MEVSDHQPRVKRDAAEKLREKLLRTRKVDLERPRYLEITRLERILESVRKKKLDERMQRWKNRMRENPSHVFRWLDGKQGPPIHNIYDECDDDATQNIAEVLETWHATGERSGSARAPSCPICVRLCSAPLAPLVRSKSGRQSLVQSLGKRRRSKQALRLASMAGPGTRSPRFPW